MSVAATPVGSYKRGLGQPLIIISTPWDFSPLKFKITLMNKQDGK